MAHGAQKLFGALGGPGVSGVAGYFQQMGIAPAVVWAWVVSMVEFFGGAAILIGLLTRVASGLIVIDMVVAILKAHWSFGFDASKGGYELALSFGVVALVLVILGPGPLAIDRAIGVEKR
jgi:putative oxidoreductase